MPIHTDGGCDGFEPGMRIRRLSEMGASVDVDEDVPLRRYFRSGNEMIRMANVYMEEGSLENAFVLYSKFITLFVEKLPQHKDYKLALPADKGNVKKKLNEAFPQAEKLKLTLKTRYADEFRVQEEEKKRRQEQMKQEEERRQLEEQKKRIAEAEKAKLEGDREKQIQAQLERFKHLDISSDDATPLDNEMYNWPSSEGQLNDSVALHPVPNMPSRELKPQLSTENYKKPDLSISSTSYIPIVDRSTKPSVVLSPGSVDQDGSRLRTIFVPSVLMTKFLRFAQRNTDLNVETCGILTGKLAKNQFTITHLLIPKQRGTSDSCSTENEEEIFEYQDEHDLITLGWIHTHPSQTTFMSSVDLHTHCSYQLMLPEAIAIVCAPKHNETGIFSLTSDYGLNYIAKCKQSGFHPHPKEPPLYIDSEHVVIDTNISVEIIILQ